MCMKPPKREHNACNPADTATRHGDCWGAGGGRRKKQPSTPSATPYGEHGIKDINNQETGFAPLLPRIAEVHMKAMNQWAQKFASSLTHTHTKTTLKFLNLVSGFPYLTKIFDVQTAPFVANLYLAWLPSPASSEQSLRATEMVSSGFRDFNILPK